MRKEESSISWVDAGLKWKLSRGGCCSKEDTSQGDLKVNFKLAKNKVRSLFGFTFTPEMEICLLEGKLSLASGQMLKSDGNGPDFKICLRAPQSSFLVAHRNNLFEKV